MGRYVGRSKMAKKIGYPLWMTPYALDKTIFSSPSGKSGPYRQESTSSAVSASCNTPDSGVNQRSGVLGCGPGSGGSTGGGDQSGRQQYHRFSDSMTSSTSSSGFGTDIHR